MVLTIAIGVFFGLTYHQAGKGGRSSTDSNICWDQSIKIGVVPPSACRSIYINVTSKALFLLCIVFTLFSIYTSQILRACEDFSLAIASLGLRDDQSSPKDRCDTPSSAESEDELIGSTTPSMHRQYFWNGFFRLIRAAGSGFATFYSGYILFMYFNDSYSELVVVQCMLSIMQLCLFLYVSSMFNRKSEALNTISRYPDVPKHAVYSSVSDWSLMPCVLSVSVTKVYGSVILGMILFKLMFNFVLEMTCSYGTNDWRTFMFVLSDIVDLVIILGLDGLSFGSRSGGNPLAMGARSLISKINAYFKGTRSSAPTVATSTLIIHTTIVIGTCGLWYALMFGLIRVTDQRVC